ncbi:hypothetical protein FRC04_005107 [Tulasnella sp. 424]|nr:hypothetical protein FRC04_005107 [Tulasnella sp. 424]KAG8970383.1 hypothetical protein FRC05_000629 [Tulasnella sp. 425]
MTLTQPARSEPPPPNNLYRQLYAWISLLSVAYPRDQVVKSRIQGAERIPGVAPKYNWTYPSLAIIAKEEGAAALYKGFVPKVLRLAPGGGVLLLVVEATLNAFAKALGPPYV